MRRLAFASAMQSARIIRNLEPMLDGIDASGYGERFHLYVLSDSNDAGLAMNKQAATSELAERRRDRIAITYRRRTVNTGYKAGNIRDFCERWEAGTSLPSRSMPTAL